MTTQELKDLITRYSLTLAINPKTGCEVIYSNYGERIKRDGAVLLIRENKPEIIACIKAEKAQAEAADKARKEAIDGIEGLKEIQAAMADLENWQYEFERSFDDVGGLGVRPKPTHDIKAMKAQYPRAAAYLRAEEYWTKTNYELSAIGKKAMEDVIFGDWEKAMEAMDTELAEFSARHAWD